MLENLIIKVYKAEKLHLSPHLKNLGPEHQKNLILFTLKNVKKRKIHKGFVANQNF